MSFFKFLKNFVRPFFYLVYRIEFRNKGNLPKEGGYVVCSNHTSDADPFFIAFAIKQDMSFMAKNSLFKNFILRKILYWIKMIPVDRGAGDTKAIEECVAAVNENRVLGIFPEGTRSKDGNLLNFKSGAMYIAKAAKAGVVPICVTGKNGGKIKWFKKVIVNIGEFISFEELGLESDERRALPKAKKIVFASVQQLLEENRSGN